MAPGVDVQKPNEPHRAKTFPLSVRPRVGKRSSAKCGDCGWQLGRWREGGCSSTRCLETAAIPASLELCTWGGWSAETTPLMRGEFVKASENGSNGGSGLRR